MSLILALAWTISPFRGMSDFFIITSYLFDFFSFHGSGLNEYKSKLIYRVKNIIMRSIHDGVLCANKLQLFNNSCRLQFVTEPN